eukprot:SAG31_NODE_543_length_14248_cov_3.230900_6_plen_888_part_00
MLCAELKLQDTTAAVLEHVELESKGLDKHSDTTLRSQGRLQPQSGANSALQSSPFGESQLTRSGELIGYEPTFLGQAPHNMATNSLADELASASSGAVATASGSQWMTVASDVPSQRHEHTKLVMESLVDGDEKNTIYFPPYDGGVPVGPAPNTSVTASPANASDALVPTNTSGTRPFSNASDESQTMRAWNGTLNGNVSALPSQVNATAVAREIATGIGPELDKIEVMVNNSAVIINASEIIALSAGPDGNGTFAVLLNSTAIIIDSSDIVGGSTAGLDTNATAGTDLANGSNASTVASVTNSSVPTPLPPPQSNASQPQDVPEDQSVPDWNLPHAEPTPEPAPAPALGPPKVPPKETEADSAWNAAHPCFKECNDIPAFLGEICDGPEDAHKPQCIACAKCIATNSPTTGLTPENTADIFDGVAINEYGGDFDGATTNCTFKCEIMPITVFKADKSCSQTILIDPPENIAQSCRPCLACAQRQEQERKRKEQQQAKSAAARAKQKHPATGAAGRNSYVPPMSMIDAAPENVGGTAVVGGATQPAAKQAPSNSSPIGAEHVTLTLALDIAAVGEPGSPSRAEFETKFKQDVAATLGQAMEPNRIIINSISSGSVTVDFTILPNADGTPVSPATIMSKLTSGTVIADSGVTGLPTVTAATNATTTTTTTTTSTTTTTTAAPVDCVGSWSEWSSCTQPCGGGATTRKFTVTQEAKHGGLSCPEPRMSTKACNEAPCQTTTTTTTTTTTSMAPPKSSPATTSTAPPHPAKKTGKEKQKMDSVESTAAATTVPPSSSPVNKKKRKQKFKKKKWGKDSDSAVAPLPSAALPPPPIVKKKSQFKKLKTQVKHLKSEKHVLQKELAELNERVVEAEKLSDEVGGVLRGGESVQ